MENKVKVALLGLDRKLMSNVTERINNSRPVVVIFFTDLKDFLSHCVDRKPDIAGVSVSFPHKNISKFPKIINNVMSVPVIAFGESQHSKTRRQLSTTKADYKITGVITAHNLWMKILNFKNQKEQLEAKNGDSDPDSEKNSAVVGGLNNAVHLKGAAAGDKKTQDNSQMLNSLFNALDGKNNNTSNNTQSSVEMKGSHSEQSGVSVGGSGGDDAKLLNEDSSFDGNGKQHPLSSQENETKNLDSSNMNSHINSSLSQNSDESENSHMNSSQGLGSTNANRGSSTNGNTASSMEGLGAEGQELSEAIGVGDVEQDFQNKNESSILNNLENNNNNNNEDNASNRKKKKAKKGSDLVDATDGEQKRQAEETRDHTSRDENELTSSLGQVDKSDESDRSSKKNKGSSDSPDLNSQSGKGTSDLDRNDEKKDSNLPQEDGDEGSNNIELTNEEGLRKRNQDKEKERENKDQEKFRNLLKDACDYAMEKVFSSTKSENSETFETVSAHAFIVEIESYKGFLMLANSFKKEESKEVLDAFKIAIFEHLKDNGIIGKVSKPHIVRMLLDDYSNSVKEFSDFTLCHQNEEKKQQVASFLKREVVEPKFQNCEKEGMYLIDMKIIPPQTAVNFDAFLYLPKNKRFVRYLKEGRSISLKQAQRHASEEAQSPLYLPMDQKNKFIQFFIQNTVDWELALLVKNKKKAS